MTEIASCRFMCTIMRVMELALAIAMMLLICLSTAKGQQNCPSPDADLLGVMTNITLSFRSEVDVQIQLTKDSISLALEENGGDRTAFAVRRKAIEMVDGFINLTSLAIDDADALTTCLALINEQVYRPRVIAFSSFLGTQVTALQGIRTRILSSVTSRKKRQLEGAILDQLLHSLMNFVRGIGTFLETLFGPNARYACRYDPDEIFVTVNDGIGFDVRRVFVQGNSGRSECSASEGNGSFATPFRLSINPSTCGVTGNGSTEAPYEVQILATRHDVIITNSDFAFLLICNGSTSATISTNITRNATTYISGTPIMATEELSLYMMNAAGQQMTTCVLGENIKLGIDLEKSPTAQGARPKRCTAYNPVKTAEIDLLVNGCPQPNNPPDATLGSGFARQAISADTATLHSGIFKCFKFPGSNYFTVECEVEFCSRDDDSECIHALCDRRRRRSVTADKIQIVYDTIRVTMSHAGAYRNDIAGDNRKHLTVWKPSEKPVAPKLLETPVLLSVVCTLSVAVLVIIAMLIIIWYQRKLIK